jgi:preprotein translocase subunit SecG
MNLTLLVTLLYIVFIASAIVLCIVVLLQEGKGGGLTDALGTAGQQTFGVAASGIHKFTGWTGAIFIVSALGIHMLNRQMAGDSVLDEDWGTPPPAVIEAPPVTPPAGGEGGTPPGGG